MQHQETWRVITEAPKYEVSSQWRVRNIERYVKALSQLLKGDLRTDNLGSYLSDPNWDLLEKAIKSSLMTPKKVATNWWTQYDYIFELSTGNRIQQLYQRKQIMARVLVANYFPELLHTKKLSDWHQILFHVDWNRANRDPSNIWWKHQEFHWKPEKWNEEVKLIIKEFLVQYDWNVTKVLAKIRLEDNDANWQAVHRLKLQLIKAWKLPTPVDKKISEETLLQIKKELEQCIKNWWTQERIAEKYWINPTRLTRLKEKWFPEHILPIWAERIAPNVKERIGTLLKNPQNTYQMIATTTWVSLFTVFKIADDLWINNERSSWRRPIPDEVKQAILVDFKSGMKQGDIAKKHSLSQGSVSLIINGKK
jgi:hypothetical protein